MEVEVGTGMRTTAEGLPWNRRSDRPSFPATVNRKRGN